MITFSLAISLAISVAVEAVGSSSNPLLHTQRELQRRALPKEHGCPACPSTDREWLEGFNPTRIPLSPEDQDETYDADWYPEACSTHGYVCIEIDEGINYRDGGFGGGNFGAWSKSNGRQVWVWPYWQSTIQFTGAGVTFNIYPAHCTNYIIAKGERSIVTIAGEIAKAGGGELCIGDGENYTDVDIGIIQFLYYSGEEEPQGTTHKAAISNTV